MKYMKYIIFKSMPLSLFLVFGLFADGGTTVSLNSTSQPITFVPRETKYNYDEIKTDRQFTQDFATQLNQSSSPAAFLNFYETFQNNLTTAYKAVLSKIRTTKRPRETLGREIRKVLHNVRISIKRGILNWWNQQMGREKERVYFVNSTEKYRNDLSSSLSSQKTKMAEDLFITAVQKLQEKIKKYPDQKEEWLEIAQELQKKAPGIYFNSSTELSTATEDLKTLIDEGTQKDQEDSVAQKPVIPEPPTQEKKPEQEPKQEPESEEIAISADPDQKGVIKGLMEKTLRVQDGQVVFDEAAFSSGLTGLLQANKNPQIIKIIMESLQHNLILRQMELSSQVVGTQELKMQFHEKFAAVVQAMQDTFKTFLSKPKNSSLRNNPTLKDIVSELFSDEELESLKEQEEAKKPKLTDQSKVLLTQAEQLVDDFTTETKQGAFELHSGIFSVNQLGKSFLDLPKLLNQVAPDDQKLFMQTLKEYVGEKYPAVSAAFNAQCDQMVIKNDSAVRFAKTAFFGGQDPTGSKFKELGFTDEQIEQFRIKKVLNKITAAQSILKGASSDKDQEKGGILQELQDKAKQEALQQIEDALQELQSLGYDEDSSVFKEAQIQVTLGQLQRLKDPSDEQLEAIYTKLEKFGMPENQLRRFKLKQILDNRYNIPLDDQVAINTMFSKLEVLKYDPQKLEALKTWFLLLQLKKTTNQEDGDLLIENLRQQGYPEEKLVMLKSYLQEQVAYQTALQENEKFVPVYTALLPQKVPKQFQQEHALMMEKAPNLILKILAARNIRELNELISELQKQGYDDESDKALSKVAETLTEIKEKEFLQTIGHDPSLLARYTLESYTRQGMSWFDYYILRPTQTVADLLSIDLKEWDEEHTFDNITVNFNKDFFDKALKELLTTDDLGLFVHRVKAIEEGFKAQFEKMYSDPDKRFSATQLQANQERQDAITQFVKKTVRGILEAKNGGIWEQVGKAIGLDIQGQNTKPDIIDESGQLDSLDSIIDKRNREDQLTASHTANQANKSEAQDKAIIGQDSEPVDQDNGANFSSKGGLGRHNALNKPKMGGGNSELLDQEHEEGDKEGRTLDSGGDQDAIIESNEGG